ncbi:hypothetical protein E2C01_046861 [Portunus trituberculatus]|uniref:Uncharacterized protein n=1 Tax=Portunus trituberculatus TaxID=210409 RepID=A0A5B7G5Y2_PORTR|nr:hypothetical protein [Portunus trituberculatus]
MKGKTNRIKEEKLTSSALTSKSDRAALKNSLAGLPITSACTPVAYSRALMKGPTSRCSSPLCR